MEFKALQEEVRQDEEGAVVTILDKTGEPYTAEDGSEMTFTVLGSESRKVRKAVLEIVRRRARGSRTFRAFTEDDAQEMAVEQAAAAVIDWHGVEHDGKPWPCEPENVKALLRAVPHILSQVQDAVNNHSFFIAAK